MSAGVISNHTSLSDDVRIPTAFDSSGCALPVNDWMPSGFDRDAVCLWWVNLDWDEAKIAAALTGLAPDEHERANSYYRAVDRTRFVAARTCLRRILGLYVDVAPGRVTFERGQYGKLRLGSEFAEHDVHFNLAHSEAFGVFVVATGRQVGVDVECVRSDIRSLEMARHFFSPEEHQALEALHTNDRLAAFYRCWTRKEAYAKAIGAGLSLPFNSFSVSISACSEGVPMFVRKSSQPHTHCRLIDISPNPKFAATLAILDPDETPRPLLHIYNRPD
jgi:4'-phosphopantetheinyl transferase